VIFWILFLLYQGLVAVVCCTNFPATPLVRHLLCYATGACKLPRSGVKGPRGFKGAVEIRVRAKAFFSIQEFWDKGLCDWKEEAKIPKDLCIRKSLGLPWVPLHWEFKNKNNQSCKFSPQNFDKSHLPRDHCQHGQELMPTRFLFCLNLSERPGL
jgi:hypothetical protein